MIPMLRQADATRMDGIAAAVGPQGKVQTTVDLQPGVNTIVIEAFDAKGNRSERHVSVIAGDLLPEADSLTNAGSARMSDSASSRVVRGGSYSDPGERLRSAAREPFGQTQSDATTGIRVVREVAAASH